MTIEKVEQNLITGEILRREKLDIGTRERFPFRRKVIVLGNTEIQVDERGGDRVIYCKEEINRVANIGMMRFWPFPPKLIYLEWTLDTP